MLPTMIPSSELRVAVEGTNGRTLYDIAEAVRDGQVRLAVTGAQTPAPAVTRFTTYLPAEIPSEELRRVNVDLGGGRSDTLYNLAAQVRSGRVRLAVTGGASPAAAAPVAARQPQVDVQDEDGTLTITVTVSRN